MPGAHLRPAFLSVSVFDSDLGSQAQHLTRSVQELNIHLMQHLTEILRQVNLYVQTFRSPREWAFGDHAPMPSQNVIHANWRTTFVHV